jgi:hypothetical protein
LDEALTGFSVLEWRDDASLAVALAQAVDRLVESDDLERRFEAMPSIEPPEPPPAVLAGFRRDAREAFMLAARSLDAGDLAMAEEFLFESLACSCAGDDVGGRASACLELGRLLLLRVGDARSAAIALEYASGHFLVLGADGAPAAAERRDVALHLFARAQLLSGDASAAAGPDAQRQDRD